MNKQAVWVGAGFSSLTLWCVFLGKVLLAIQLYLWLGGEHLALQLLPVLGACSLQLRPRLVVAGQGCIGLALRAECSAGLSARQCWEIGGALVGGRRMCWPAMKGGSESCGGCLLPMLGILWDLPMEILYLTGSGSVGTSAVGLLTRDHFFNFASNWWVRQELEPQMEALQHGEMVVVTAETQWRLVGARWLVGKCSLPDP